MGNDHPRRIQSHHSVTFDKNTFLNLPSKCSKKSLWKRNMYNIQRQNRETTNILPNQMHRHWADTISSFCLIHKLELREYNSCTAARADTQHAVALQANESWTLFIEQSQQLNQNQRGGQAKWQFACLSSKICGTRVFALCSIQPLDPRAPRARISLEASLSQECSPTGQVPQPTCFKSAITNLLTDRQPEPHFHMFRFVQLVPSNSFLSGRFGVAHC